MFVCDGVSEASGFHVMLLLMTLHTDGAKVKSVALKTQIWSSVVLI